MKPARWRGPDSARELWRDGKHIATARADGTWIAFGRQGWPDAGGNAGGLREAMAAAVAHAKFMP
jgi:hypothetical protein